MRREYSHEEKIQVLRDAYEFVKSEQGTYNDFIYSIGVPRGTYYQWVFKYSDEAGVPVQGRKRPSNQKMVVIGKPQNRVETALKRGRGCGIKRPRAEGGGQLGQPPK